MSKVSQSASNFYSTISYPRPATTSFKTGRGRMMSTIQTFKHGSTHGTRPQTGTVVSMRSSSSSFRNTKGRLETLADGLTVLHDNCKDARVDAKDLQLQLDIMKQDLDTRGIDTIRIELMQQIKALEKTIKIRERSDLLKYDALHQTCQALSRNSKEIKTRMHEVSQRLCDLQNMLGFHGVRDKIKEY